MSGKYTSIDTIVLLPHEIGATVAALRVFAAGSKPTIDEIYAVVRAARAMLHHAVESENKHLLFSLGCHITVAVPEGEEE